MNDSKMTVFIFIATEANQIKVELAETTIFIYYKCDTY